MKKLSFLLLPLIAAIFICGIIYLSATGFDAQKIVSLRIMHAQHVSQPQNPEVTSDGRININTASKETLMLLKGIGETLAERIVAYREENGPYMDVSDLLNVKGIGKEKLQILIAQIATK